MRPARAAAHRARRAAAAVPPRATVVAAAPTARAPPRAGRDHPAVHPRPADAPAPTRPVPMVGRYLSDLPAGGRRDRLPADRPTPRVPCGPARRPRPARLAGIRAAPHGPIRAGDHPARAARLRAIPAAARRAREDPGRGRVRRPSDHGRDPVSSDRAAPARAPRAPGRSRAQGCVADRRGPDPGRNAGPRGTPRRLRAPGHPGVRRRSDRPAHRARTAGRLVRRDRLVPPAGRPARRARPQPRCASTTRRQR